MMPTRSLSLLVALTALAPLVGAAQVSPVRPEPAHDEFFNLVINRRARLGLKVNLQAVDTDSIGARVDAVSPGGPAAKAGIRSGDIIVKLDGKSLVGAPETPELQGRSVPGLRLVEEAARLAPNDTVQVEFRRDGALQRVSLVTAGDPAGPRGPRAFSFAMPGPPDPEAMKMMAPDADLQNLDIRMPRMVMLFGGELAELELAPLNPELGPYFGTNDGVLVISAPKGSPLGLKGGDVVLSVDGRKPATPAQLLRILRSYDGGESFKIDVLRNHKRETVTAKRAQQ